MFAKQNEAFFFFFPGMRSAQTGRQVAAPSPRQQLLGISARISERTAVQTWKAIH